MTIHNFMGNKKPSRINIPNVRMEVCAAMTTIKGASLRELKAFLEEICVQIGERMKNRPQIGDVVRFMTNDGNAEGTVIKVNKHTVTVLINCAKPELRVNYDDLQGKATPVICTKVEKVIKKNKVA